MSEELDKIKFAQETKDRDRELALREREVALQEAQSRKRPWQDPVFVGLVAAVLALLGNIYTTFRNERTSLALSERNAALALGTAQQSSLLQSILEVMHNEPEKAELKLRILIDTGVIEDGNKHIENAVASGLFKRLVAKGPTDTELPPDVGKPKPEKINESLISQQTLFSQHGAYAQISDPPCGFGPTCTTVKVKLAIGKTITRIVGEAREPGQLWRTCATLDGPWQVCDIGWSAWNINQNDDSVTGTFKNWSGNREREARISVYGR